MRALAAALVLSLVAPALARAQEKPVVKVELLADVKTAKPGEPFRLGVRVEPPAGWHIYWKNPGESGLPTTATFKGASTGPLEYPLPEKLDLGGGVLGYCYEKPVLFLAPAKLAGDIASVGTSVTIEAHVSWLCCKEACVPGEADVKLVLPVAAASEPSNRAVFEAWQARVPPSAGDQVAIETRGAVTDDGSANELEATIRFKAPISKLELWPAPEDNLWLSAIDLSVKEDTVRASFKAAVVGQKKLASDFLEAVVCLDLGGARRSFELRIPLRPSAPRR